jgi:outer membrane receptor for ferrienterochelin and colicins
MKNIIILIGILLYASFVIAQQPSNQESGVLYGLVTNEREELLIGATVFWKGSKQYVLTDTSGRFKIKSRKTASTLVVHYVGYSPAEVEVLPDENNLWVEVTGAVVAPEVVVTGHSFDNRVSTLETRNIESISSKELRKAPCCNLSESFQTNGAIDVAYPNALTGVKEIQLLGLRGIYSQFLIESRPTMTGIATPFGFEYIPGSWLNGIILAKGASTVRQGFNGITGQVNADLVRPSTDKPLFLNVFTSSEGRGEINAHINKKTTYGGHGLYLHGSLVRNEWDMNQDTFYDSPQRHQLNAMYRWIYDGPDGCIQFNVQAVSDRRQSGQIMPMKAPGFFDVSQDNDRVEVWGKYGKEQFLGHRFLELGNIVSASWHRASAKFGPNNYDAEQQTFFFQPLLQTIIGNTNHKMVFAPTLQHEDIKESVNEGNFNRVETVTGIMAEYTFSRPNLSMEIPDLVVVAGSRLDWNSRFGWLFTPRASAKYNFTPDAVVRISAGKGYRSPNLWAENISILASNRSFSFAPDLKMEEAWNYGANYTHNFEIAKRKGSISVDLYRTDFQRQIIADVDASPTQVRFYNVPGASFANSILAVAQFNPIKGLDLKFAYKWNDARATYYGENGKTELRWVPLTARQRGLVSVDYTTPDKKWLVNTHVQIIGTQRLPDNSKIPHRYTHDFPVKTPTYSLWNAQITRAWKKLELYAGCENITGFQQHHAIIAANEPQSPYFNGSQIWAPMMRQIGYMGIRWWADQRETTAPLH